MAVLSIIISVIVIITLTAGAFYPLWKKEHDKISNKKEEIKK